MRINIFYEDGYFSWKLLLFTTQFCTQKPPCLISGIVPEHFKSSQGVINGFQSPSVVAKNPRILVFWPKVARAAGGARVAANATAFQRGVRGANNSVPVKTPRAVKKDHEALKALKLVDHRSPQRGAVPILLTDAPIKSMEARQQRATIQRNERRMADDNLKSTPRAPRSDN